MFTVVHRSARLDLGRSLVLFGLMSQPETVRYLLYPPDVAEATSAQQ